jgi:hypothetical protein
MPKAFRASRLGELYSNKGTTVTGNGGSEDVRLFAALNKVCGKK